MYHFLRERTRREVVSGEQAHLDHEYGYVLQDGGIFDVLKMRKKPDKNRKGVFHLMNLCHAYQGWELGVCKRGFSCVS